MHGSKEEVPMAVDSGGVVIEEDTELVEFSPKGEYQKTLEVAQRNVAAMQEDQARA